MQGSLTRRPHVITHNAASVDGRLAVSPGRLLMLDDRWPASGNDVYADVMERHHPQALLEGSGSFVTDDAGAAALPEYAGVDEEGSGSELRVSYLPDEAVAAATRGWLVVPDSRGRVAWQYKQFPSPEWEGWHLLVLVSDTTPLRYLAFCRAQGIPYLVVGTTRADLPAAMSELQERFGVDTVVATGGGRLGGALLRAGLVDVVEVETLPILVGGTTTPGLFTAPDLDEHGIPVSLVLREVSRSRLGVRTTWDVVSSQ